MITFYIERQPDDLLRATFFDGNGLVGFTVNISEDRIDSAVEDISPNTEKQQIFEKPNVI